jgi:hypothetical protein
MLWSRNDETIILAGLHAAVLKFHNNSVDYVQQQGGAGRVRQSPPAYDLALPVADPP